MCRAWLYKLFQVDQYQISLRNVYTNELMKQLKSGELSEPFDKFPQDKEPLIPLTTYRPTVRNESFRESYYIYFNVIIYDIEHVFGLVKKKTKFVLYIH